MDWHDLKRGTSINTQLRGQTLTFSATWGLFSPTEVDRGTRMLAELVEVPAHGHLLDLGCGYGVLGCVLARVAPRATVHLVDTDALAVEYAQKNIARNQLTNAQAYYSNGFEQLRTKELALIVSNIPAKVGRELLTIWLHEAYERLSPGGRFYVVTVTGLRKFIKRIGGEIFGNYTKLKQGPTHTVAYLQKA